MYIMQSRKQKLSYFWKGYPWGLSIDNIFVHVFGVKRMKVGIAEFEENIIPTI